MTIRRTAAEEKRIEVRVHRLVVAMVAVAVLALAALPLLCSSGCAGLLPPPSSSSGQPSDDCRRLDDNFVTWSVLGIASGSLAGAAGASGILSATLASLDGADAALAASSAVLGALAAVAAWASGHYAGEFARDCMSHEVVPP